MLTCAISDRHLFTGTEQHRAAALHAQFQRLAASSASASGHHTPVTFFQLREKDLAHPVLADLLHSLRLALPAGSPTRLLLNGPPALAAAHGAHGVHLPSGWTPASVASARAAFPQPCTITASAHTLAEAAVASTHPHERPDALLFGPVFEKSVHNTLLHPGSGLPLLAAAVRAAHPTPVLALGGITLANTPACLAAGAAGIAAIRLFL